MFKYASYIYKTLNGNVNCIHSRFYSNKKWNVIFFGTDNFSLYSLEHVYKRYLSGDIINKLEIVSNLKSKKNVVHKFAEQHNINIHQWPLHLSSDEPFDLGIVVSFGYLIPQSVINLFPLGILNVHASLLPKWRGAAPIVHSLLNGDSQTGVTIMRINPKHFDTGEIILQKELDIPNDILQPELHDKLGLLGTEALIECLDTLPQCLENAKPQDDTNVSYAPKITKHIGVIKWQDRTAHQIYNLSRALYGIYPLQASFKNYSIKLFRLYVWEDSLNSPTEKSETKLAGHFKYVKRKNVIRVWCKDGGSVYFDSISLPGRKPMSAADFNNGFLKDIPYSEHYFNLDETIIQTAKIKNMEFFSIDGAT